MNVSVGGLFLAGFVPGIACGLGLMVVTKIIGERRNYPKREKRASFKERTDAFKQGIFPLLTPVIIIGGILIGVFTPTEAGAAAVVYAFFISVFVIRDIKIKDFIPILLKTGVSASAILLAVGTAVVFGWISTLSGIPNKLSAFIFTLSDNKYLLLLLLNIFFLIVGMFLDAGPAILILGPIVAPLMYGLGVEPLHFAIIMCVNLTIGLATPPMGLILFVASSISRQPIESIAKNMLPYYIVHILIILAVTFIPALSLTIPRYFGMGI
jgi:tripartite ATP-independent transporter DctM subunit